MAISLNQYARLLGSNTVIGMAQKVGLTRPPPPISVRNVINRADQIILPSAPVDLVPQNGATGISTNPDLFFRDPGAGTPAAAQQFEFIVTQNNIIVDPTHRATGPVRISSSLPRPGTKWLSQLPGGQVTLTVSGINKVGKSGPKSTSTFSVVKTTPTPTPQHGTLTLQVTLSLPAFSQSITGAKWSILGPGAPQAPVTSPTGGPSSQVGVPLPIPQGSATYTVLSNVAFAYDGLVRDNGTSGPENSQVELFQPTALSWTGQSRVARFAVIYDALNNVFNMKFEGLFG